ncbi:MAG: hypothetical protein K2V38_21020, partial [Gemmataceae bacterium]|nr:hypothetical protein [Gemmataceae bacterium]
AVVAGAALVAGSTGPTRTPGSTKAESDAQTKTVVVVGQRTGYFNMAKVMRDYRKAPASVARLNRTKDRLSANLVGLRAMYIDLQARALRATTPAEKERVGAEMLAVVRRIEDTEREVNKLLNDRASVIIAGLHDDIRAAVAAVARDNGLTAMLAYPDAVTPEEAANPAIKELRLKPPALHPFYIDPSAEYSDEIVRRLNDKFADTNDE